MYAEGMDINESTEPVAEVAPIHLAKGEQADMLPPSNASKLAQEMAERINHAEPGDLVTPPLGEHVAEAAKRIRQVEPGSWAPSPPPNAHVQAMAERFKARPKE